MVDFENREKFTVYDLRRLVKILRSEEGCPWDREQTHESIRRSFLEEAYEVAEAIDERNPAHLREELGDVLLQVIFHAQIEDEQSVFDLDDVADAEVRKMLFRHPHVFGDETAATSGEVLENWDKLKRVEKGQATVTDSLRAVATSLPGLWRAEKLKKKAAKVGFDFADVHAALGKLREELGELEQAINAGDGGNAEKELGDVLFSAANVASFLEVDPEDALSGTCERFIERFELMERAATESGRALADLTPEEQDKLYRKAKAEIEAGK
ncbi:MAG: nucleoside triphosphate pyrophosphohydrolase [Oscillospiraceae bacterium]|jgi:tetrapyrrole methylase family protein/MazG family protein|nr:nucleoside triphosphate pyrophosphohydrolase [Oscillospiraceae bacterium]